MNDSRLRTAGELIGVLAVIGSLVFVGLEIRRNAGATWADAVVGVTGSWYGRVIARHAHRGEVQPTDGSGPVPHGSRHRSVLRRDEDGPWKIARDVSVNPPLDPAPQTPWSGRLDLRHARGAD